MQKGESAIREYCKQRKFADFVIENGLEYLIPNWERRVQRIKDGYDGMIYEYLNDIDTRQIIHEVWALASDQQIEMYQARLEAADRVYVASTEPVMECIWGEERVIKRGYNPEVNWWYYRTPKDKGIRW